MSRLLVTGVFLAALAGAGLAAANRFQEAIAHPATHEWAVAGFSTLKAIVVASFALLVAIRHDPRRRSRDPLAFVACAVALAAIVVIREPTAATATVLVGDVVALVSCGWLLVSVLTLGRCFGVLPEARGLVTRGPYAIVRHPVYLGELGACAGLVIGSPTAWNLGAAVAFLVAQLTRMRLEERALAAEFPEYGEYTALTPRLIPAPRPVLARAGRQRLGRVPETTV